MPTKSKLHESYERAAGLAVRLLHATQERRVPGGTVVQTVRDLRPIEHYVTELLRLADRLHRYAEAACNYQLSEAQERRVAKLEERVKAICAELGIGVTFNGDPRGYAVKLHLPSGDYNTWGGQEEGWGI